MTYKEKLTDPRWQKKRLEVMQSADFACEMCKSKESTLHVHHVNYRKGAKPWDYDDCELVCLCESCHEGVEENIQTAREICSQINKDHLKEILFAIEQAYFDAISVGARFVVVETLSGAARHVIAKTIINSVVKRNSTGEKIDSFEFESKLRSFLAGGEVVE